MQIRYTLNLIILATGGPNFNMKTVLETWDVYFQTFQNQQFMYQK